ncbi:ComEA family DNA-binding protein [Brevibacillus halotolerans]|uniref:ComEA family DNA-binding protein n=1 Tax=Brevibacillus TaxID=55080 RepID=UPI00215C87ED|nr:MULTISPECIES: ComEA family DNA-binding protein [Brevibacillus]MCR8965123.1 ComEA family DNA-binding protein [Brevibacillus laterosporus]MCZ0837278.1 ComEA family DNA-binding protein [Brevibacillus halotolerans]
MVMELWDRYRKWIFVSAALLFIGLSFWIYPAAESTTMSGLTPVAFAEKESTATTELQTTQLADFEQKNATVNTYTGSDKNNDSKEKPLSDTRASVSVDSSLSKDEPISNMNHSSYIDVKGAVTHPGLYSFDSNERVMHVIQKAGGFLAQADQKRVNLAQKLTDGMVLYVPTLQESATSLPNQFTNSSLHPSLPIQSSLPSSSSQASDTKINIKTATLEQLMKLPGIGKTRAEDIIAYRDKKGFTKLEDLMKISGIGKKTFEKIKKIAICE